LDWAVAVGSEGAADGAELGACEGAALGACDGIMLPARVMNELGAYVAACTRFE
jgi:hypothetical protein